LEALTQRPRKREGMEGGIGDNVEGFVVPPYWRFWCNKTRFDE